MLLAHVLYLDLEQRAVGQGHAQDVAGGVGVDVDLDYLVVVDQHHAVAYGSEPLAHTLRVAVVLAPADELGAVGEIDLALVEFGKIGPVPGLGGGLRGGRGGYELLAAEHGQHGLEYEDVALAAGVHNSRALEHGVEVDGIRQGLLRGLDGAGEHELQVAAVLGEFHGRARRYAEDGEYGALGGLHDGLVRRVHAGGHGLGEEQGVGLAAALELLGKAAEEQAEYDAGVAARAAQHGAGRGVRRGAEGGIVALAELRRRGAHGEGHVSAGVAVGDGEDVELVDELPVLFQRGAGAEYHVSKKRRIDVFFQEALPPTIFLLSFAGPAAARPANYVPIPAAPGGPAHGTAAGRPQGFQPIIMLSTYTSTRFTGTPVALETL